MAHSTEVQMKQNKKFNDIASIIGSISAPNFKHKLTFYIV